MPSLTMAGMREAAGLTQEGLAFLLGVDRATILRWEQGQTEPTASNIRRLAWALRVDEAELLRALTRAKQTA